MIRSRLLSRSTGCAGCIRGKDICRCILAPSACIRFERARRLPAPRNTHEPVCMLQYASQARYLHYTAKILDCLNGLVFLLPVSWAKCPEEYVGRVLLLPAARPHRNTRKNAMANSKSGRLSQGSQSAKIGDVSPCQQSRQSLGAVLFLVPTLAKGTFAQSASHRSTKNWLSNRQQPTPKQEKGAPLEFFGGRVREHGIATSTG